MIRLWQGGNGRVDFGFREVAGSCVLYLGAAQRRGRAEGESGSVVGRFVR